MLNFFLHHSVSDLVRDLLSLPPRRSYDLDAEEFVPRRGAADLVQEFRRHTLPEIIHELSRGGDRKSTRLNSSHVEISYAVFCLKKKSHLENSYDIFCLNKTIISHERVVDH